MECTPKKVEARRSIVRAQDMRMVRQRETIARADANRHPADELQARLLVMEQSLICMARFLNNLERNLTDERSLQKIQTQKRIKSAVGTEARPESAEATVAQIPAQEEQRAPFETIVKAMRKLAGD